MQADTEYLTLHYSPLMLFFLPSSWVGPTQPFCTTTARCWRATTSARPTACCRTTTRWTSSTTSPRTTGGQWGWLLRPTHSEGKRLKTMKEIKWKKKAAWDAADRDGQQSLMLIIVSPMWSQREVICCFFKTNNHEVEVRLVGLPSRSNSSVLNGTVTCDNTLKKTAAAPLLMA